MAAHAGKHILVEKPIARTPEEGWDMVSSAQQAGVTLMVAKNHRFMGAVRRAKELIDGGAIGGLRLMQLQEEVRFQPQGWRNNRELNGDGRFIDAGIHKVDVLVYLAGMPENVYAASLPRGLPDVDGEDGLVLMTTSWEGVVGVINHSWTWAQRAEPPWVTVSGTRGRISFRQGASSLKVDNGASERTLRFGGDHHGLAPMVREFRDSIREGREPQMSGAAGMDDLAVVLKAYESVERGVSLPFQ